MSLGHILRAQAWHVVSVMRTVYLKWRWADREPHCRPSELVGGHWLSLQLHLEVCTQTCLHLNTHWGSRATVGTIITSAYRGETKVSAVSYSTYSRHRSLCFQSMLHTT